MDKIKLTREEALRRWKASKETKRKMVEKLENLVRNSCLERTDKEPNGGRSMVIEMKSLVAFHIRFFLSFGKMKNNKK